MHVSSKILISVAARSSLLSRAQVQEVQLELGSFYPNIVFVSTWVATTGDLDLKTSLRLLEKTDFFTREIDQLLLKQICRIAIHSAKDLPDPIQQDLEIVALTQGVDARDALVFRKGKHIGNLPENAHIGVSCHRREEAVKILRPLARFSDIRGPVDQRLQQLDAGKFDAIVVAEAALLRLGLQERARLYLEGPTAPLQGQLAILAHREDEEIKKIFQCIDRRKMLIRK